MDERQSRNLARWRSSPGNENRHSECPPGIPPVKSPSLKDVRIRHGISGVRSENGCRSGRAAAPGFRIAPPSPTT